MLSWSVSGNWLVWWKSHAFWEDAVMGMWWDCMVLAMIDAWEGATKPPAFKTHTKIVIQARQKTQTLHLRKPKEIVYKTGITLIFPATSLLLREVWTAPSGKPPSLCSYAFGWPSHTEGPRPGDGVWAAHKPLKIPSHGSHALLCHGTEGMYSQAKSETLNQWNTELQSNFLNDEVHVRRKFLSLW